VLAAQAAETAERELEQWRDDHNSPGLLLRFKLYVSPTPPTRPLPPMTTIFRMFSRQRLGAPLFEVAYLLWGRPATARLRLRERTLSCCI
jgi:hypothetical protein